MTLIVGLMARKDARAVFAALKGSAGWVLITGVAADLAADPRALAARAREVVVAAEAFPDVAAALEAALAEPGPVPHVIVCGSLYLAGEVLALSPQTWPQ